MSKRPLSTRLAELSTATNLIWAIPTTILAVLLIIKECKSSFPDNSKNHKKDTANQLATIRLPDSPASNSPKNAAHDAVKKPPIETDTYKKTEPIAKIRNPELGDTSIPGETKQKQFNTPKVKNVSLDFTEKFPIYGIHEYSCTARLKIESDTVSGELHWTDLKNGFTATEKVKGYVSGTRALHFAGFQIIDDTSDKKEKFVCDVYDIIFHTDNTFEGQCRGVPQSGHGHMDGTYYDLTAAHKDLGF